MTLYTGCVDDGLKHKKRGLVRYLTISKLSDNTGLKPREDLWNPDKFNLYDIYFPIIAPDGKDVYDWYQGSLTWEDFSKKYIQRLRSNENEGFLLRLVHDVVELDLHDEEKGVVLQCVCEKPYFCHRSILAEEIKKIVKNKHKYDLRVKHL